jgi:hypothetical protein
MVIEAPLGAGFGVTAGPDAQIDGVDRLTVGCRVLAQQRAEGWNVDASRGQGVVEAAPAAAVYGLQTEAGSRAGRLGRQQGVAKLEEGIGTALEAVMQGSSEGAQALGGMCGHGAQIARLTRSWPTPPTTAPPRVKSQA